LLWDQRLFVLSYDDLLKLLPQLTARTEGISTDLGWTATERITHE
jgi:hypothetical protein